MVLILLAVCMQEMKIDPNLSPFTKLQSKWIKDLNIKPYTLNVIEEKVGKSLELIGTGVLFRKFPPVPISSRHFPTFYSIRFSVSGFVLRSLIHLYLGLVQGDKHGSIFILPHIDSQLDQHHLLKMLSFFHCIFLASLSKIKWL